MDFTNLPPSTLIIGEAFSFLLIFSRALLSSLLFSIPIVIFLLLFKKTRNFKAAFIVFYTVIGYKAVESIVGGHFLNLIEVGHSPLNARISAFFILIFLTSLFLAMSLTVFYFLNKQKPWKYILLIVPCLIVYTATCLQNPH
ncbi:MAG: hypothetical protein ABH865_07455 [Candidatus Omnitrophota bacterium]